jgi:hypothetical protein
MRAEGGQLTGYPFTQGASRIWALYRDGSMKPVAEGMTTVVGIAIDPEEDALIVVSIGEWNNDFGFFLPGTGSIVSIDEEGVVTTVIDQLLRPPRSLSMTMETSTPRASPPESFSKSSAS